MPTRVETTIAFSVIDNIYKVLYRQIVYQLYEQDSSSRLTRRGKKHGVSGCKPALMINEAVARRHISSPGRQAGNRITDYLSGREQFDTNS